MAPIATAGFARSSTTASTASSAISDAATATCPSTVTVAALATRRRAAAVFWLDRRWMNGSGRARSSLASRADTSASRRARNVSTRPMRSGLNALLASSRAAAPPASNATRSASDRSPRPRAEATATTGFGRGCPATAVTDRAPATPMSKTPTKSNMEVAICITIDRTSSRRSRRSRRLSEDRIVSLAVIGSQGRGVSCADRFPIPFQSVRAVFPQPLTEDLLDMVFTRRRPGGRVSTCSERDCVHMPPPIPRKDPTSRPPTRAHRIGPSP